MKKIVLTMAAFSALSATYAQKYMGISTSNWAGTQSIYLNPSSIADSRTKLSVDLFSLNFGVDNNLASVNFSNALSGSSSGSGGASNILSFSNNNKFNLVLPVVEVRMPGVMYSIDENNTVAITTRVRVMNQFNNFDKNLFRTIMEPNFVPNSNYSFTSTDFNWTLHMWSEFNLSYGRVLYKEKEHFLKAGVTLGRAGGLGYVSVKGANLDATFNTAAQTLNANHTDIQFASSIVNNGSQLQSGLSTVTNGLFGGKSGSGFRSDLGVTYEYRPDYADWEGDRADNSVNKYKVRASAAITDIGSVKYKTSYGVRITGNGTMSAGDLASNFTNYASLSDYAASRGFHLDSGLSEIKVHLPTALIIGADYYVASHFYVNGTWLGNIANRQNYGNSYYGQLTITPRWDTKAFCASLPLTYSGMTKSMKVGLGLRAGGFFIGSDDMLVILGGSGYGVNFYMGAYVPIAKRHPKNHAKDAAAAATPKAGG